MASVRMLLAWIVPVLASFQASAQTTAGTGTTIVFPVTAQTGSFASEVTIFNPGPNALTAHVTFFEANNSSTPGTKVCAETSVPVNRSTQFSIGTQCPLAGGSHFGLLVVADAAQTNAFYGYTRVQNPVGIGFSVEGFPVGNFNNQVSHSTGLKRQAAAPTYQTNCFVGSLDQPVSYEVRLFNDATGAQIGGTLSGSLNAFEQFRYLDVFGPNGVNAPAGDQFNVRAQFTQTSGGTANLIGFCTVQDNTSFGADFRIAKSYGVPGTVTLVNTGPGLSGGPITTTGTINLAATNLLPIAQCAVNEIPKWNGSAWACSADATGGGGSGGTVSQINTGTGLTGGPITTTGSISIANAGVGTTQLADAAVTLAKLNANGCSNGQILKFNGSAWTCAADNDTNSGGTVTSITAGSGLSGGTITSSGTIAIDPSSGTLSSNYFKQGGNAFPDSVTAPSLGTTNNHPLEIIINNQRVAHFEPNAVNAPDVVLGYAGNAIYGGVVGATIGGGGAFGAQGTQPPPASGAPCQLTFGCVNGITDSYGTIAGGVGNIAGNGVGTTDDARFATVGGGVSNWANAAYSTIAGGVDNLASGENGAVGGGSANRSSGLYSTVSGGFVNHSDEEGATVGGGGSNHAIGAFSTIPGGANNLAQGILSFAAGYFAHANAEGCMVFSDHSSANPTSCTIPNEFIVRALGGVYFFTGGSDDLHYSGAYLNAGSSTWLTYSDRNGKENFVQVDALAVLDKLATIPISTWNWKTEGASIRHMGPMAQDFRAGFGLGPDDKHISTVDADGVALAAIQGLHQLVKEKDARIAALEQRLAEVELLRGEFAALKLVMEEMLRSKAILATGE